VNVVLDSEALSAAAQGDLGIQALLLAALTEDSRVILPAVVLAETMTGKADDAARWRVVGKITVVDTTARLAARAGALRDKAAPSRRKKRDLTIDAIVAATAESVSPAIIVTADPGDLNLFSLDRVRVKALAQRG
jgi:predicted nucleic acid-binding protein